MQIVHSKQEPAGDGQMLKVGQKNGVTFAEGSIGNRRPHAFVYLVDGMLIDTGPQKLHKELTDFYQAREFNQVVLTHSHEDHTGTAAWLTEHRGVPVYLNENGIGPCTKEADYPRYRQEMWGQRPPFTALPLGDTISSNQLTWNVIYTPGHATDHVCLLNSNTSILFSGDLYLASKVKLLMKGESMPALMQSIRKVLALDFEHLFCSHAGYVADGRQRMKSKLEFMENLTGEILQFYQKGWTAAEIDQQMFPEKPTMVAYSSGEFDTLHIVTSVLEEA